MKQRSTIQRSLILDAVQALQSHATADEVYAYVVKRHPHVSRATVYRNLNLLSQAGEILKVEAPDGVSRYDHQCHAHYHAQCMQCGRVVDVDMAYIPDITAHIGDTQGFSFLSHDIVFKGLCPECIAV